MDETGIYFSKSSDEVFLRGPDLVELPNCQNWIKISDDINLSLLAVRDCLLRNGFVTDTEQIHWYEINRALCLGSAPGGNQAWESGSLPREVAADAIEIDGRAA